jgi:hypothetical protein
MSGSVTSYPLCWPSGWKRTTGRSRNNQFKGTFDKYRRQLFQELERMGVRDYNVILSTNLRLRYDGMPYAETATITDPGVAVYFEYKGKPMCFACDRYSMVSHNIHAIGLTIESIRAIERHGASDMMERAFIGFTALPQARGWRELLGLADGPVTEEQIKQAFRLKALANHADHGGNGDMDLLTRAKEEALKEIGA